MYNILFYQNEKGESPVWDFLKELEKKSEKNKSAKVELHQMLLYIELLERNGTKNNTNITKKIIDNVWELRPGNNRILYFYWDNNSYVLLHCFRKKTQKTPPREIAQAKKEIMNYLKYGGIKNEELD